MLTCARAVLMTSSHSLKAVGKPQTEADRILKNRNLTELMRIDIVPVISFAQLVKEHNAKSIGYLKLDVEGYAPESLNL